MFCSHEKKCDISYILNAFEFLCFRASEPSWVQCWATINNTTHTNLTGLPKEGCTSTPNSPGDRTPPPLTKTHDGTKQQQDQTALKDKLKNAGGNKTKTGKKQYGWLPTKMHLNYALKVDSITCFRQQLFYLTELNSTPEIKPSLSVATVVAE